MGHLQQATIDRLDGRAAPKAFSAPSDQPPAVVALAYLVPVPVPGMATGGVGTGPKSSFAGARL